MQIRKLSHQNIDTIIEFLQAMLDEMASCGGHTLQNPDSGVAWLREQIQAQIGSPERLFLGVAHNASSSQLIGVLEASIANLPPLFQPKSFLHINAIYVVPECRRSGVARSLIEAAFQWGRDQGCTEVNLNVLQHSLAKSLYERLGFEAYRIGMQREL